MARVLGIRRSDDAVDHEKLVLGGGRVDPVL
eukprot:CAMPEP_0171618814 /NCGR_PEP_ID=MMETSP0990-20121206/14989_1 /TAXON_ID=483369 /ORGANISM="non described non described, Strain CCMP2098" /LENGTH=30 /DNA_ID= /DNA_START= /DNA_END= /DNA_ORIENTATION=